MQLPSILLNGSPSVHSRSGSDQTLAPIFLVAIVGGFFIWGLALWKLLEIAGFQ